MSESNTARPLTGEDEVVDLCRDLIRMDTTNPEDHSGLGGRLRETGPPSLRRAGPRCLTESGR